MRLLAVFLGLTLIAAACGGDDDTDESSSDESSDTSEAGTETSVENRDEGEPQYGGRLVYGVEADTSNPWTPQDAVCATSCHLVMRSIYDTLTIYDENREVQPNLLESFEANDDYTRWTLTPREGITFHDGTPFDAAAIVANLAAHKASFLTSLSLINLKDVVVSDDGAAAIVTTFEPWATFPSLLTAQIGYIASPKWLAAVEAGTADATEPVGTGPFVYESYEAGNNFVATKNPNYWRDGLPYLDAIEFRVLSDVEARKNALLDGQIDMMHTSNGTVVEQLRDADVELTDSTAFAETAYTLLNVGREDSPVSDIRVRKALAMAIDNDVVVERRAGGIPEVANGPFSPDQLGYLEDTPYPEYNPEGARALVEEYKQEKGLSELKITYTTTTDPANLGTAELLKQMWAEVGINVELAQIEQGDFIVQALLGNFEMFSFRGGGGVEPANLRIWWHSETAKPRGEMALNFGRISDPVVDKNLDTLRASLDPEVRKEAAEALNRAFTENVYQLFHYRVTWGIGQNPAVNGLHDFVVPNGSPGIEGSSGVHQTMQLWMGS